MCLANKSGVWSTKKYQNVKTPERNRSRVPANCI